MSAAPVPEDTAARPGRARPQAPALDLGALITDPETRIVVCCGAGGVGKTTTSAALALAAAQAGRTVVVLTIDPARRLAQAVGGRDVRIEPIAGRWLRVVVLDDPEPPADVIEPARPGPRRRRTRPVATPCPAEGAPHSFR